MSARIATPENVQSAVLALSGRGEAISADAVIREIGGGSKATVTPMLRKLQSTITQLRSETADVPALVKSATSRAMLVIWAAAQEEARHTFEGIQQRYEAFLSGQAQELDTVSLKLVEIEQQNQALQLARDALVQREARLASDLRAAEDRSRILMEQNLTLEGEKAALQIRLDEVEGAGGLNQQAVLDLMTRLNAQLDRVAPPAIDAADAS